MYLPFVTMPSYYEIFFSSMFYVINFTGQFCGILSIYTYIFGQQIYGRVVLGIPMITEVSFFSSIFIIPFYGYYGHRCIVSLYLYLNKEVLKYEHISFMFTTLQDKLIFYVHLVHSTSYGFRLRSRFTRQYSILHLWRIISIFIFRPISSLWLSMFKCDTFYPQATLLPLDRGIYDP